MDKSTKIEFDKRMCEYKKEMRNFIFKSFSILFISSVFFSYIFFGIAHYYFNVSIPIDWRVFAFIAAIAVSIPIYRLLSPDKPTEQEILFDSMIKNMINSDNK